MRKYGFENADLKKTNAHNGHGNIWTSRVEQNIDIGVINFIDVTVVPPGKTIGYHLHSFDSEEIYFVVSGEGLLTVDGISEEISPGQLIVNSPGSAHGLENNGDEDIKLLVVELNTKFSKSGDR